MTQAGEEFGRTKQGDENSFRSPIEINQLDWKTRTNFLMSCGHFYQGMWQIRKFYPPLRDARFEQLKVFSFIESNNENFLAYIYSE